MPATAQLARPIEAELRELVGQKRLVGRGRGRSLTLNAGSLYDWLGQPTSVPAAWGRAYEVFTDDEVGWRRESRERIREQIKAGPHSPMHVLPGLAPSPAWLLPEPDLTRHDVLLRSLADRLRAELARLSGAFGAVDVVIQEVREAFNGHDPAHPTLREVIERAREELAATCSLARKLTGDLELPECDTAVLEQLHTAVSQ